MALFILIAMLMLLLGVSFALGWLDDAAPPPNKKRTADLMDQYGGLR